jgi:hypothetical protein
VFSVSAVNRDNDTLVNARRLIRPIPAGSIQGTIVALESFSDEEARVRPFPHWNCHCHGSNGRIGRWSGAGGKSYPQIPASCAAAPARTLYRMGSAVC